MDDSKWLLSPSSQAELEDMFGEEAFYFVLFEFADLADPREIDVRIWRVDPLSRGFAYCMVDYLYNIRPASTSHAPFNLWPRSVKFSLMGGALIYWARIKEDGSIQTHVFPGEVGDQEPIVLHPLGEYASSTTLSARSIRAAGEALGLAGLEGKKAEMLVTLESERLARPISDDVLSGVLAEAIYGPLIAELRQHLPESLREPLVLP